VSRAKKRKKAATRNCWSSSGYNGDGVININEGRLYDLMAETTNARGDLGRSAKEMIEKMANGTWRITAGIHAGGIGGGGRGADARMHITVQIDRDKTYHVRLHSSNGRVIEIT
jgi:hypothetical protein